MSTPDRPPTASDHPQASEALDKPERKLEDQPSYTPMAQTDNEIEDHDVAERAPSYTPQGRTDNA